MITTVTPAEVAELTVCDHGPECIDAGHIDLCVCGEWICTNHTRGTDICPQGGPGHHEDCWLDCDECQAVADYDRACGEA